VQTQQNVTDLEHDPVDQSSPVRVMVAIGINPSTERLLLRAAKLAQGLHGSLYAIHIHPQRKGSNVYHANVQWHLDQARRLGAVVEVVRSNDVAAALVKHARKHNITHLVMGQSDISRWQEVFRGSIINKIMRYRSGVDLYIVTDVGH
jgi:two-component system, OmpR family, sensor histidine kinase KdpD